MRDAIRRAKSGSSEPTPLVFIGQRGMGKTVLLRELRDLGSRDTLAIPIEIVKGEPLADTLRDKLSDLLKSVEPVPSKAADLLDKTLKALPKLSYELPHDAGAISLGGSDEEATRESQSVRAMLQSLNDAARSVHRFAMITVDEVQYADVRSMRSLVRFVHESGQAKKPMLCACAGLGDTRDLFDELPTYVRRWSSFDLRYLTTAETIEAIRDPIVAANVAIDDDALDSLVEESFGYPFFIQLYASAAWEARRSRRITLLDVQRILPEVRHRNEVGFYVRPLARMTPRETVFALALADLGPGTHDIGSVARSLGVTAPDISSIRMTLARKGLIASPIPGKVEFRMPFTDRYLRSHRTEYENPEVLAYRAGLIR